VLGLIVGLVLWFGVFVVALPLMTVALGLPMSLLLVAKQTRGALVAFVSWIVLVRLGALPAASGPFGIPSMIFWPAATVFGAWWAWGFAVMSRSAWRRAMEVNRLMRDYGMPASEIC
jgi:hypothetical protein